MKRLSHNERLAVLLILIVIIGLSVSVHKCNAQDYRASISGVYAHQDNGLGIKAGYNFGAQGLYVSFSHGNYFGLDCYNRSFYIKDHNRVSGGYAFFSGSSYFSLGLVYHSYGSYELTERINPAALEPVSFEFGVGCSVGRFTGGFRFDAFRWEGMIDVGIRILKLKQ